MPIGKNAIKRVENNGYSKVESKAPDMENSQVAKKPVAPVKAKKPTTKKTAPKKTVAKPVAPVKDGFEKVSFGQNLPYWLL